MIRSTMGFCRRCNGSGRSPYRRGPCAPCGGTGRDPLLPSDLQAWREHGQRLVALLPEPTAEDERIVGELLREMGADDLEGEPIPLPPDDTPEAA